MAATHPTGASEGVTESVPGPRHSADREMATLPTAATGPLAGDPAVLGVPCFTAGCLMLGLVLINFAQGQGGALPIIIIAAGFGQVLASAWAAAIGHSAPAAIFGLFGCFWLSFATLLLGLTHNWFGVAATAATHTTVAFSITWLVVFAALTVATLRMPLVFTAVFVVVEVVLALVIAVNLSPSQGLSDAAGIGLFVLAALGAYIFASSLMAATGGKALPLGRPVLK